MKENILHMIYGNFRSKKRESKFLGGGGWEVEERAGGFQRENITKASFLFFFVCLFSYFLRDLYSP